MYIIEPLKYHRIMAKKSKIQQIADVAKNLVSMSVNGKYNYAPIDYYKKMVFGSGDFSKRNFSYYYRYAHKITDAKTFFVREFINFDLLVYCSTLKYVMNRAFPEITDEILKTWILEHKEEHHILCEKWW